MHYSANRAVFNGFSWSLVLAVSIGLYVSVNAAPGETNSVNDGQIVNGGTYFNTPGQKTTFTNTGKSGLHIQSGTIVKGLEVKYGKPTGNGGHLHFNVPGQVVRLDGTINVNAMRSGGSFIGNGGKVTITAGYLYQSGQITANGMNGGTVNLNVGSLTMTPTARTSAQGKAGLGGKVKIGTKRSLGAMDIQRGAIVNTSGETIGSFDRNLISIEGGLIHIDGILRANGVKSLGPVRSTSELRTLAYSRQNSSLKGSGHGGTILLVAKGNTRPVKPSLLTADFMADVRPGVESRNNSLIQKSGIGWVRIGESGKLLANGDNGNSAPLLNVLSSQGRSQSRSVGRGYKGGLISILAQCGIENDGLISANGGNGADSSVFSVPAFENTHRFESQSFARASRGHKNGGDGGKGGKILLASGYKIINNGIIRAKGGQGGDAAKLKTPYPSVNKVNILSLSEHGGYHTYLGKGGKGGIGGKIVTLSNSLPEGSGKFVIKGGLFGNGKQTTGARAPQGKLKHYLVESCSYCPEEMTVSEPVMLMTENAPGQNLGLFQEQRPVSITPGSTTDFPNLISMGQSTMFLSKTYQFVTQAILDHAQKQYLEKISQGETSGFASEYTAWFLKQSGIDASTASKLLDKIGNGDFKASNTIVSLLKSIAASTT